MANQNKTAKIRILYIFKKKWLLDIHVGWIVANQTKKTKIKALLCILGMLYTGCSVNDAMSLLL